MDLVSNIINKEALKSFQEVFEEALNAVKFLGWLKKFGPAQNILWPVKGQGIQGVTPTKGKYLVCKNIQTCPLEGDRGLKLGKTWSTQLLNAPLAYLLT